MADKTTLEEIKKMVLELDPSLKRKDSALRFGVIMLASALNELKTDRELRDFTHYQLRECFNCLENLKNNGLGWQGEHFVHSGWDNEMNGGTAFWLDVLVSQGYVEKSKE